MSFDVRHFDAKDANALHQMMLSLADFEDYTDKFSVKVDDLIDLGLSASPPFHACIAQNNAKNGGAYLGMAAYYFIPYSTDLTPEIVLKELYVHEKARSQGVGEALMDQVKAAGRAKGARRLKWLVLKDNDRAKAFYQRHGGREDTKWENWHMAL